MPTKKAPTRANRTKRPPKAAAVKMREARARAVRAVAVATSAEDRQEARDLLLGETIKVTSAWYGAAVYDTNPDDLLKGKGRGLKTYQQMLADPYVKAGLRQIKSTILSPGWEFVPPPNATDREREAHEFTQWCFESMDTPMTDVLWGILGALDMGYSVSEKVLAEVEDGPWAGMWRYAHIKDKDPYWIQFDLDEYATVKGISNLADVTGVGKGIDPRRVIVFVNDPRYSNPWGNSELRAAYRAWVMKDTFWKLWAMYGERNITPMVVGTYPAGDDEAQEALEEIVENIQFGTAVTLPKVDGLDIRALQLGSARGTMDWEAAIELQNKELLIAVVGSFLSAEEGRNVGSRSATDSHIGIMSMVAHAISVRLVETFMRQATKPIVRINFGPDVRASQFRFKGQQSADRIVDAQVLNYLYNMDTPIPLSHVQQRFGIPAPRDGEPVLQRSAAGFSAPARPDEVVVLHGEGGSLYSRPLTAVEKLAEPELRRRLAWEATVKQSAMARLRAAYKEVFGQVRKWVVQHADAFKKRNASAAANLPVNVAPVKAAIQELVMNGMAVGYAHVLDFARRRDLPDLARKHPELEEDVAAAKGTLLLERFADDDEADDFDDPKQLLGAEELERKFRARYPMTRNDYRRLMDEFGDRAASTAVTAAGLSKTDIQRSVQTLMVQAIGEGMSLELFQSRLNEMEVRYVEPVYNRVGTVGKKVLDYHAENIFRTNLASGYAEGKRAALEEPLMKILMPAQQYSAVLDDRTCLPAGTPVMCADGNHPIEVVQPGMLVWTHGGRLRRVKGSRRILKYARMVTVVAGKHVVQATDNHPFLIERRGVNMWARADELRTTDRVVRIGATAYLHTTKLHPMRRTVLSGRPASNCAQDDRARVLFCQMLERPSRRQLYNANMPMVWTDRSGAAVLCEAGAVQVLLRCVPHGSQAARYIRGGAITALRNVWNGVSDTPVSGSARPATLLKSVFASASSTGVPYVRGKLCLNDKRQASVLLCSLLPAQLAAHSLGAARGCRFGGARVDVQERNQARAIRRGFHDTYHPRSGRGGRRILACSARCSGTRSTARCPVEGDGFSRCSSPGKGLSRAGTEFGRASAGVVSARHSGTSVPMLTTFTAVPITALRISPPQECDVWDLQVEEDRSFIAAGFVVHNSEFCREMDGRVFKTDDPIWNWVRIPAHYNCRADTIPIDINTFTADMLSEYPSIGPQEGFGAIPGVPAMMAEIMGMPALDPVRTDPAVQTLLAQFQRAERNSAEADARAAAAEEELKAADAVEDEEGDGGAAALAEDAAVRWRRLAKERRAVLAGATKALREAALRAARLSGADVALANDFLTREGVE